MLWRGAVSFVLSPNGITKPQWDKPMLTTVFPRKRMSWKILTHDFFLWKIYTGISHHSLVPKRHKPRTGKTFLSTFLSLKCIPADHPAKLESLVSTQCARKLQCILLLTWFDLNPSMNKKSHAHPKLQRLHRWNLGMDKYGQPTLYNGCNYLCMLRLKLSMLLERAPGFSHRRLE